MRLRFYSVLLCATLLSGAAQAADGIPGAVDLRLKAVIAEGAKPLDGPLAWTVTRLSGQGGMPGEIVARPTDAAPKLSLAPGRYVVSVKYGDAERHEEIRVGPGETKHVLNLDAGFIRVTMIPYTGASPVNRDITWEVYPYIRGMTLDRTPMFAAATSPSQLFVLPEGYYTVRARFDGATADMLVPVTAGHRINYTLNLYAGEVGLAARTEKGAVKKEVTWQIVRADPGKDGTRQIVAKTIAAAPSLLVREGRYVVQAQSGSLRGEAPLEVKAGNTQTVTVMLSQAGGSSD